MVLFELFNVGIFPIIGAIINGKSICVLGNIKISKYFPKDNKGLPIRVHGPLGLKIPFRFIEFCFGIISEAFFILILIPVRSRILRIFFDEFKIAEKWNVYVLFASICSVVVIGIPAIITVTIRSYKIGAKEITNEHEANRQQTQTVEELISDERDEQ